MNEPENPDPERLETSSPERQAILVAEAAGYFETPELRQQRLQAVELTKLADLDTARTARANYHVAAQNHIEPLLDAIKARAQVGVMVAKGSIYLSAGDTQTYADELDDAIMYAEGMGYDELMEYLERLKAAVEDT